MEKWLDNDNIWRFLEAGVISPVKTLLTCKRSSAHNSREVYSMNHICNQIHHPSTARCFFLRHATKVFHDAFNAKLQEKYLVDSSRIYVYNTLLVGTKSWTPFSGVKLLYCTIPSFQAGNTTKSITVVLPPIREHRSVLCTTPPVSQQSFTHDEFSWRLMLGHN